MRVIVTTLLVYGGAVAAVFGLQLLVVTALAARGSGTLDLEGVGLAPLLAGVSASSLGLVGIAWVAAGRPRRERLRLGASRRPASTLAAMIVGALALSQVLESLAYLVGAGPGPSLDWIARTLAAASPLELLLAVLVIGGLAPVGEELFFRGFMQTRLRQVWSAGPAILVSALAFGLIHGEWAHGVLAAGLGLYLGLIAERTGSVLPAVLCHVANNTMSVLLSAWAGPLHGRGVHAVLLVLAAALFVGAVRWLLRAGPDATG
jgi:membrane protease YdiL (CAAX protease family)